MTGFAHGLDAARPVFVPKHSVSHVVNIFLPDHLNEPHITSSPLNPLSPTFIPTIKFDTEAKPDPQPGRGLAMDPRASAFIPMEGILHAPSSHSEDVRRGSTLNPRAPQFVPRVAVHPSSTTRPKLDPNCKEFVSKRSVNAHVGLGMSGLRSPTGTVDHRMTEASVPKYPFDVNILAFHNKNGEDFIWPGGPPEFDTDTAYAQAGSEFIDNIGPQGHACFNESFSPGFDGDFSWRGGTPDEFDSADECRALEVVDVVERSRSEVYDHDRGIPSSGGRTPDLSPSFPPLALSVTIPNDHPESLHPGNSNFVTPKLYAELFMKLWGIATPGEMRCQVAHRHPTVFPSRSTTSYTLSFVEMLVHRDPSSIVSALSEDQAYAFMELLGYNMTRLYSLCERTGKATRHLLRKLSERLNKLPKQLFVRGLELTDPYPVKTGGFSEIFKATHASVAVAVKRLRTYLEEPARTESTLRRLRREVLVIWDVSTRNHPYILPLIGLDAALFPAYPPCIVTPWMENGTIMKYLETRIDRMKMEALICLFRKVAEGLEFLHRHDVVHGDFCGRNILVDLSGTPRIADFGLSWFADISMATATNDHGSRRWMAPELFDPDVEFERTPATDVFALGCTYLEMCTGREPFSELLNNFNVQLQVTSGRRPSRYPVSGVTFWKSIPDWLWLLIGDCWKQEPKERLAVAQVVTYLKKSRLAEIPLKDFAKTLPSYLGSWVELRQGCETCAAEGRRCYILWNWPRNTACAQCDYYHVPCSCGGSSIVDSARKMKKNFRGWKAVPKLRGERTVKMVDSDTPVVGCMGVVGF